MSKPRFNSCQRALFAMVKAEAGARGGSARTEPSGASTAAMTVILSAANGREFRLKLHGTPKDEGNEMRKVRGLVLRLLAQAEGKPKHGLR